MSPPQTPSARRLLGSCLALLGATGCVRWSAETSGPEGSPGPAPGAEPAVEVREARPTAPVEAAAAVEPPAAQPAPERPADPPADPPSAATGLDASAEPASPPPSELQGDAPVYAPTPESAAPRELPAPDTGPMEEEVAESRSEPAPARFVPGAELLGLPVQRADGSALGTLDDAVIDPEGGRVLAFVVLAEEEVLLFDADVLAWDLPGPARTLETASARDALDLQALFQSEELARIEGEVAKIESVTGPRGSAAIVLVRDDENLLHRLLLGGGRLALRRLPGLAVGSRASFEGVLTRDERGKLWIARSVAADGEPLELRDERGAVLWSELAEGFPMVRQLQALVAPAESGGALEVAGWLFDVEEARAAFLTVDLGDGSRLVPWRDLVPADGTTGAWSLATAPPDADALPDVTPGDPGSDL